MGAAGLGGSPFVVLHPGSDWACQQWPVERWAGLADELIESRGLAVALTGSSGEREYVEQIRSRMRSPATSFAGKTSLGEVEALLAHATLCICVDSAVRDLARAAGVETLVLAGHPATTGAQRTADPLSRLVVLSRTPASLQASIDSCKDGFYRYGQCHDTSCPMSGLRDIAVADVLAAVEARLPALRSTR